MPLTTDGKARVAALINGEVAEAFNTANTYVGVGDSSAAFAVGQTDLQAATNKVRVPATLVSRTGNVLTITAEFDAGEANWVWNEVSLHDDPAAGLMLVREVASLGTKAAGVWTLTLSATVG